jgi:protein-tyrosine-phosphatase
MKILFVCENNISRSQIAETFFNELVKDKKHKAGSAGVRDKHDGDTIEEISKLTVRSMKEAGLDIGKKKSKKITKKKVKDADFVVMMNHNFDFPDYVKESKRLILWDVEDPKGRDLNVFIKIRDRIHLLVNRLIDEVDMVSKEA